MKDLSFCRVNEKVDFKVKSLLQAISIHGTMLVFHLSALLVTCLARRYGLLKIVP